MWISIQEKQPEFDMPVLVCQENNRFSIKTARLDSYNTNETNKNIECIFKVGYGIYIDYIFNITHWMPLIEVPKSN